MRIQRYVSARKSATEICLRSWHKLFSGSREGHVETIRIEILCEARCHRKLLLRLSLLVQRPVCLQIAQSGRVVLLVEGTLLLVHGQAVGRLVQLRPDGLVEGLIVALTPGSIVVYGPYALAIVRRRTGGELRGNSVVGAYGLTKHSVGAAKGRGGATSLVAVGGLVGLLLRCARGILVGGKGNGPGESWRRRIS